MKFNEYAKIILLPFAMIFFVACAISPQIPQKLTGRDPSIFNLLDVGMTEEEVVNILGTQESTSVSHGAKVLQYTCIEKSAFGSDQYISYGVLLRENKVLAYGRHTTFANDPVRWKLLEHQVNRTSQD